MNHIKKYWISENPRGIKHRQVHWLVTFVTYFALKGLIIQLLWFPKYVSEFSDISQICIVEISSFICSQNFYFRGFSEADIFSAYIRHYGFFYTPNLWACCHWYDCPSKNSLHQNIFSMCSLLIGHRKN